MMAEFLIWTQVVSYWTSDIGFTLKKATDGGISPLLALDHTGPGL